MALGVCPKNAGLSQKMPSFPMIHFLIPSECMIAKGGHLGLGNLPWRLGHTDATASQPPWQVDGQETAQRCKGTDS